MGMEQVQKLQFNSAEIAFIECVEANVSETEANNFHASLSMNRDRMIGRVAELMDRHELYKVDRQKATPRVQKAWNIMDKFIAGKWQYLQDNGITPVVFGSVTFDDPATFDFDLGLVGMNENQELEANLDSWTDELAADWRKVGI